ncbi:MAG: hypothetical protein JJ975_08445, partial [Bacteroidia bacterium]|nr:hypothetical protein [Bacteroidia bacterium]
MKDFNIKTQRLGSYLLNRCAVLLLVIIASASLTQAGIEPEVDKYKDCDTLTVNSFLVTHDVLRYTEAGDTLSAYSALEYQHYGIQNTAYLEIIETLDSCFLDTFSFWVDLEVRRRDLNKAETIDTVRLKVKYDTSLDQYNATKASFTYEGAMWMKATILAFSDVSLKKFMRIGQTYNVERYRDVDLTTLINFNGVTKVSGTDEIKFSWDPVDGAESYHLEWTWLDAIDNSGTNSLLPETSVIVSFRNNATRVNVTNTYYSISPAYQTGYLVIRVRGVGVNKFKKDQPVFGPWSHQGLASYLSDYTQGEDYVELSASDPNYDPLDEGMNWQYAATFAENGKRKEVISYFDGSLRTRQSVTRISTNMQAIVGETVYDYEGRPAVNILPVPAFDQNLRFHPAFNISQVSNKTYNKEDFDETSGPLCQVTVNALKTNSGASNYYSPENDSASSRYFGFIPDAHGYPMTATEYMADGTGRIKRQGGVGSDHQLGTGHETKYYYATPGEQELDRLFGNDVGEVDHYQKEMVVDPNGQVSVSYKDLSGKVIATSLAGTAPTDMEKLSSEATAQTTLKQTIPSMYLNQAGEIRLDNVLVVSTDNTLHEISYDLNVPRFTLDETPGLCFDCVYELEISLKDDCDQELLDGDPNTAGNQPIIRTVGIAGQDFDVDCEPSLLSYDFESDSLINANDIDVYLNVGSYTLTKVLRVSDNAYEYYWDQIKNDPNTKTLADFEAEAIAEQDTASCDWDCNECRDSLGTFPDFELSRSAELSLLGYTTQEITELVQAEWDAKVVQCEALCFEVSTTCDNMYNTLLMDVMPEGQYFPGPDAETGVLFANGILDVTQVSGLNFNYKQYYNGTSWQDIAYLDENGDPIEIEVNNEMVTPNELTRFQFYRLFDQQWAHTLVKYHPEYCRYEFCKTNEMAYRYNDRMYEVTTYRDAYRLGYLDPLGQGYVPVSAQDSVFTVGPQNAHKAAFQLIMDGYSDYGIPPSTNCNGYKMLEIALLINYSDGNFSSCNEVNTWLSNLSLDTNSMCDERADAVWKTFRGMYISAKESYFNDNLKCSTTIPANYEARFPDASDLVTETGMDDTETDPAVITAEREAKIFEVCDPICENQAEYWLTQLGGCNLPQNIQDDLIDAFTKICKNGCDAEHPMGARNYPASVTPRFTVANGARSFEEAFDNIVPANLKELPECDPWLVSYPYSYNRTKM